MSEQKQNGAFAYFKKHKKVIIGIGLGLVIGILMLCIGFFRTLFLAICAGIGAFFGTDNKIKKKLYDVLDRILPDIFKQ